MEDQIVTWLREHAEKHSLEQQAMDGCHEYLSMLLRDELCAEEAQLMLRGMTIDELKFQFVRHYLVFEDTSRPWVRVLSKVVFGCHNDVFVYDIEPFGYYELETLLDGEINDDWFCWDEDARRKQD